MANTVQTDDMMYNDIPPLETEALRRAAEGCASVDADECEACPFRPMVDCSGELIRCLLLVIEQAALVIEQAAVERKALLYAAATGQDLCELCAHNDRKELHHCSVNCDLSCDSNDPVCAGCVCRECNGASHFVWDDDPADNEVAGHE